MLPLPVHRRGANNTLTPRESAPDWDGPSLSRFPATLGAERISVFTPAQRPVSEDFLARSAFPRAPLITALLPHTVTFPPLKARPPVACVRYSIHSSLISGGCEHVKSTARLSSPGRRTGGSQVGLKRVSTAYSGTFASLNAAMVASVAPLMACMSSSAPYASKSKRRSYGQTRSTFDQRHRATPRASAEPARRSLRLLLPSLRGRGGGTNAFRLATSRSGSEV